jgi:ClpP class serine protease
MVKARRGKRLVGAEKDIFSGAFWTGSKALEMGLIDGIGDLRSVTRKRFGEKVRLRQISVPQSFWRQRLGLSESLGKNAGLLDTENMATSILSTIEERLTWSRFGL